MDYICPIRNKLESQIKSLPEYLKIQNDNQVKKFDYLIFFNKNIAFSNNLIRRKVTCLSKSNSTLLFDNFCFISNIDSLSCS